MGLEFNDFQTTLVWEFQVEKDFKTPHRLLEDSQWVQMLTLVYTA